jgi:hypothetical protein
MFNVELEEKHYNVNLYGESVDDGPKAQNYTWTSKWPSLAFYVI